MTILEPEELPQDVDTVLGRRNFIQTSSLALLIGALCQSDVTAVEIAAANMQPQRQSNNHPFFRSDTYTNDQLEALYGRGAGAAHSFANGNEDRIQTQQMLFFYDSLANKLVNPFNVKPSLQTGKYALDISILNSHVSKSDFDNIWNKLKHEAQLQLALTAPSTDGPAPDDLTWTLMNGIDIFLGGDGFKGIDNRLKPFVDNNKPTSKFRPSSRIEVPTGSGSFQLQLAAQKKDSWWRKLLTIAGGALNSPLFATLPIPRLLPEGVQFATAVLNHLKDTSPLTVMWTSARIPFRLYDGATPTSPFTFRPGLWLSIDRMYAEKNLDENKNLKNHVIDIPGQFNEVRTSNGQPIDANYAVLNLEFPALK
jgi:hypothetical protein